MDRRRFGLGALPPPGAEWEVGKTAASISFVNDVQKYLVTCQDEKNTQLLLEATRRVRNGEWTLKDWLTAQEYLDQQTSDS